MPLTPKQMIKFLKDNGFEEIGQKGSHIKLVNRKTNQTVIVPMHAKDLGKGLEQKILKEIGLK
ncbi:MAG: type II toxin-antitoxin system HicA family toxin [Clostridia bacterium]